MRIPLTHTSLVTNGLDTSSDRGPGIASGVSLPCAADESPGLSGHRDVWLAHDCSWVIRTRRMPQCRVIGKPEVGTCKTMQDVLDEKPDSSFEAYTDWCVVCGVWMGG
jgi:hypothetical protein